MLTIIEADDKPGRLHQAMLAAPDSEGSFSLGSLLTAMVDKESLYQGRGNQYLGEHVPEDRVCPCPYRDVCPKDGLM
jgi:hypothetical protein